MRHACWNRVSSSEVFPNCGVEFVSDPTQCLRATQHWAVAPDPDVRRLSRLQAGDEGALEELYDRYTPLLYSMADRILHSPADAEDVLQDVWCQVWRSASRYDSRRGSVVAWLLTVTRSRALDRYRSVSSRRNAESHANVVESAAGADPVTLVVARQWNTRVRLALEQLPPQQRRVLQIGYFSGMSQSAIARHLDAPLGTVKSWTRQGLTRLRELLPNDGVA